MLKVIDGTMEEDYFVKFVAVTVKVFWCDAVCSNTKARIYQVTCIAEDSK